MTSQPFPSTGTPTAADAAAGGLSLLQTAERVAAQLREEAGAEAQRMLEAARAQADQIRNEARAEAPRLRAETDELRAEHHRAVEALRSLREGIGDLVDRGGARQQPDRSPGHGG